MMMLVFIYILTVEMARQKANLCTCSKSITVEGASTEHENQEMNQEMHEASMQGMGLQLDIKFAISLHKNSIKKKQNISMGCHCKLCITTKN